MPKMGSITKVALCANCQKDIEHEYWGNGGGLWLHSETNMSDCRRSPQATPHPGTVKEV